ncbi:MAG: argininosuccinate lyase [Candidatus Omnitrophica bacterium]|nr:argininosuccinate lyase [Candidatus Omnitrophota bacterium]
MAKKMWGGRFAKKTDADVERFLSSIDFDQRLARYDILGSIAHTQMLARTKIIPSVAAQAITRGLNSILQDLEKGKIKFDKDCEDIHTNIVNLLRKKIGKDGELLHTARSRNDQVSLDTRMYCKNEVNNLGLKIKDLETSLLKLAGNHKKTIIPGYTHMQHAIPLRLSQYLGAYCQMFKRDRQRLKEVYKRINILPLGACALIGTTLPIDRNYTAKALGFSGVAKNLVDAVSERDFVIEILSILAILGMHLSRMAEDFIMWSTSEFDFIEIDERFCTGSSFMPQKKNCDVLELIRGNTGRLYGNLVSVLVMMKGMPLGYNRDLQLDKEPLFSSIDLTKEQVKILVKLFRSIKFKKKSIEKQLKDESLYATFLAEYLVKKGVAFKDAHTIIGRLIRYSQTNFIKIKDMPTEQLKKFSPYLTKQVIAKFMNPGLMVI